MQATIRGVVVHLQYPSRSSYFDDWLDAFCERGFKPLNLFSIGGESKKRKLIEGADLIVVLHSATANNLVYLERALGFFEKRKCPLLVFVGNEFNSVSNGMRDKRNLVRQLGADAVATQMLEDTGKWLYGDVCSHVISVPHALNPAAFRPGEALVDRKIRVGIRAGRYPVFLGDDERNHLLDRLSEISRSDHSIDISLDSRLDRSGWSDFLGGCQSTFSTEAGSWHLEKEDETLLEIEKKFGGKKAISTRSLLYRIGQRFPWKIKGVLKKIVRANQSSVVGKGERSSEETIEELKGLYFQDHSRCRYYSKCISSRHFDAIGTKTIQVLVDGRYNDVLIPGQHFISLNKSLSNLDDILKGLCDIRQYQKMVDETYEFVLDEHTHAHRVEYVMKELGFT